MEINIFKKVINTVSEKIKKNNNLNSNIDEYAFNSKDLDDLKKDNIEKIKELKKDIMTSTQKKEEPLDEVLLNDAIFNKEKEVSQPEEPSSIDVEIETKEELQEDTNTIETPKPRFIKLEKEHQDLIMKKWSEINLTEIEKDILEGKDLLNHNYTITYIDDAAMFIHNIRKKYEVILCYLIGFNNEKKGIYEKTFFSDNVDNDWKYLNYYIKLLEKIKNFKMHNS